MGELLVHFTQSKSVMQAIMQFLDLIQNRALTLAVEREKAKVAQMEREGPRPGGGATAGSINPEVWGFDCQQS